MARLIFSSVCINAANNILRLPILGYIIKLNCKTFIQVIQENLIRSPLNPHLTWKKSQ